MSRFRKFRLLLAALLAILGLVVPAPCLGECRQPEQTSSCCPESAEPQPCCCPPGTEVCLDAPKSAVVSWVGVPVPVEAAEAPDRALTLETGFGPPSTHPERARHDERDLYLRNRVLLI